MNSWGRRILALLLALVLSLLAVPQAARAQDAPTVQGDSQSESAPEFSTLAELEGKRVGMGAGNVFDQLISKKDPKVNDFVYFSSLTDMVAALKSGKVDAFAGDEPSARLLVARNAGIVLMPETVAHDELGFCFAKNKDPDLVRRMNEVIDRLRSDGTLEELEAKWCGADDSVKTVPAIDWDTSGGTLHVAVDALYEPISYVKDNQIVGYDIELCLMCAKELKMGVEFSGMPFESVLASVQSGKMDLAVGGISITDERKKAVDFSTPVFIGSTMLVVRDASGGAADDGSFIDGIVESFEKTFVVESRWQMVLSGLGVTLLITLTAGLLGTVLGFLTTVARRRGNRFATRLVGAFEGLLGRLPIVVVLMVFYYVIFGSIDLPGVIVAILVFTLSFASSAGAIMWNAVRAVDSGQTEASLALGFDDSQTFYSVVFPQAARQFLPLLQGQAVSLVKETSIVGYISVIDLTRASDLIRSRTMEAFFPLIATAVIYFGLCCAIAALVGVVIRKLDIERRPRTIKGVEL